MIRYLHLLAELFLIGLGLGDSRLVILYPLFLALFLFCNSFVVWFSFLFLFFFIFPVFFFPSCISLVCFVLFMHRVAFRIYIILTYKKKRSYPRQQTMERMSLEKGTSLATPFSKEMIWH